MKNLERSLNLQKQQLKNCFNKAVHSYDHHGQVQLQAGMELINMIALANPSLIIDLGCGTGLVSERLMAKFPQAELHAIDMANHLLAKTKARLSHYRAHIYAADYDQLPTTAQQFNLVFSNMALHWSFDFPQTIKEITRIICPHGLLVFSASLPGTLAELNKNSVNSFMDSSAIIDCLYQYQYELVTYHQQVFSVSFPTLFSALRSIKNVGANYLTFRRTHRIYAAVRNYSLPQAVTLNYVIGFFIAKKRKNNDN